MTTAVTRVWENMNTKIRVISFDIDGCIYNKQFNRKLNENWENWGWIHNTQFYRKLMENSVIYSAVIDSNKSLFDALKKENKNFEAVYTCLGSLRQSKETDSNNRPPTCFLVLKFINDYLNKGVNNTKLETLLLADIYGDLPLGESYKKAIEDPTEGEQHSRWRTDTTKVTILYAQIHKIANENPEKEILYDFYDDRKDIHKYIEEMYGKYPELLPKNVTVRLHQYAGSNVVDLKEINGTGFIDMEYRKTVKDMAKLAAITDTDGYSNEDNPEILVGKALLEKGNLLDLLINRKAIPTIEQINNNICLIADFILEMTNMYKITRDSKEFSKELLIGRECPFVLGIYPAIDKSFYVSDRFFRAGFENGELVFSRRKDEKSPWIQMSPRDALREDGLFKQVINTQKASEDSKQNPSNSANKSATLFYRHPSLDQSISMEQNYEKQKNCSIQ